MLNKKLLRDLRSNKGSNFAVVLVIAIGIMCFTSLSIVMDTLYLSMYTFYAQGRFPDAYIDVVAAPKSAIDLAKSTDGVASIEGRIIADLRIEDGFGKISNDTKYLRMISHTPEIGKFVLTEGHLPEENKNQIIVSQNFAAENQIKIGDKIPIISSGKQNQLEVVGIGRAPEYIYALRNKAQIFPDPLHFGICFANDDTISRVSGKNNISQIIYTVKKGYEQKEVEKNLEILFKPYGIVSTYARKDHFSNVMLTQELDQLKGAIVVMPLIMLSVSAMILFIMIKRMVDKQRAQIGLLKAFGMDDRKIFLHYLAYSVIVSILGGLVGIVLSELLTKPLLDAYKMVYNMPFVRANTGLRYAVISLLLTLITGISAGLSASTKAAQLHPSEAMRSKVPDIVHSGRIEKNRHFMNLFTTSGRMSLRNIFRNPARSSFILVGIMFTFAFAVVPWNFIRVSDKILFDNFDKVEKYNVRIYLPRFEKLSDVHSELSNYNFIQRIEGCLDIPSTLSNANLSENVSIIGIEENNMLYTLTKDGDFVYPKPNEVILTARLAEKIGAHKGDIIQVESPMFHKKDEKYSFIVSEIIDQTVGMSAYSEIRHLGKLVGNEQVVNSILIRAPKDSGEKLKTIYEDSHEIDGINDIHSMIVKMKKFMESFLFGMYSMVFISVAMGFAIIYNSYSIILSEREKEFASLLVLGMSEKEVISIIKLEQWLIAFIAIPLGFPLTNMIIDAIGKASSNDLFTLNLTVDRIAFLIGGAITVIIILLGQAFASVKIKNLKLSDALKADE